MTDIGLSNYVVVDSVELVDRAIVVLVIVEVQWRLGCKLKEAGASGSGRTRQCRRLQPYSTAHTRRPRVMQAETALTAPPCFNTLAGPKVFRQH